MSIVIGEDTIHFDDRPWSVQAYGYENGKRYRVIILEDFIANKLGANTWTNAQMNQWVKQNKSDLENTCDQFQRAYKDRLDVDGKKRGPFPDGYEIIIG